MEIEFKEFWLSIHPNDYHCTLNHLKAQESSNENTMQLFREVRNQYKQSVRKPKASFFKQKFASYSSNSKRFWDTVKSMENKSTSSQLPNALRVGNTVTSDKSMIIKKLNKHFSTAGHALLLATPANSSVPLAATSPASPSPKSRLQMF
jgi:hypothetical protein